MTDILTDFLLRDGDVSRRGPYFRGYCGEHISQYPLIQQKSGDLSVTLRKKTRSSLSRSSLSGSSSCSTPTKSYSRPVPSPMAPRKRSAVQRDAPVMPEAGSSTGTNTASHPANIFKCLEMGGGISEWQLNALAEKCGNCKEYYLPRFLKTHIPSCDGSIAL